MSADSLNSPKLEDLLNAPAGNWISQAVETVTKVQRTLFAIAKSEDSNQFQLLKIGTVFQIFLIDTLLSGKKPEELKKEDWFNIADNVSQYAVMKDGQAYSVFVFSMYADYIDASAKVYQKVKAPEDKVKAIKAIASELRQNAELLQSGELSEVEYTEKCLWVSLEAMIKCLSLLPTLVIGEEYGQLIQATSQLAFEYARYLLYAKEQAILASYIENQYILDEKLQKEYEAYLAEVIENTDRFRALIDDAFSADIHESLKQSVALGKAAGVKEEELLTSLEDIDDFFS